MKKKSGKSKSFRMGSFLIIKIGHHGGGFKILLNREHKNVERKNPLQQVYQTTTVKPPNSGQPWARKKCPLLGGVRYWEKGHIFAVERQKTGPEEAQYFHVRPPIGFI